jgi:hypothetical protein
MTVEFHRKTNGNTSVIINGRCTGEIRQYGSRFRYRPHGASDLQLGPAHATLDACKQSLVDQHTAKAA